MNNKGQYNDPVKYCHHCGTEIDKEAVVCPNCGVQQAKLSLSSKNEGFAAVLSFFITGAGQIYNGQLMKGVLLFVFQLFNLLLSILVIPMIFLIVVWIYGIWDAYSTAKKINTSILST